MDYYFQAIKRYVDFKGRANRAEYWYFVLFNFIIAIGISMVDGVMWSITDGSMDGFFGGLYSLFILLPGLGLSFRRLHDTNKSGWWMLISLVPIAGWIVLLIFMIEKSDEGKNKYGEPSVGIIEENNEKPKEEKEENK